MNAYLFPGRYLILVDAGSASSVKNALFLHQQRRKVLMATASNRGKHICEYLKNEIPNKHQFKSIFTEELIFTSINFGKKSNGVGNKFFNVISNSLEFLQSDIIN
jgi:thioredoxin-related protein